MADKNILVTQGKTKGLTYLINSELIDQNIKPSLKTLEPHALKALIYEDLKIHPNSSKNEIMSRLPDINVKEIQKILYSGCDCGELLKEGATKNRTYSLANKKRKKRKKKKEIITNPYFKGLVSFLSVFSKKENGVKI